jgi:putative oxidoreductase
MSLLQRYGPLLGRLLLSTIFILSGAGKITNPSFDADQMRAKGIPAVMLFFFLALVAELAGGLSILLGLKTRLGAGMLFVYLIPVTLIMHNFWAYTGADRVHQLENFLKNLAIMGGLLLLAVFGPGPISVDNR